MPGAGIPGFLRKAAEIAKAGIYDLRVHRDEVLLPIINHWRIFELTGLDAAAEEARRRLADAPRGPRRRGPAVRGEGRRLDGARVSWVPADRTRGAPFRYPLGTSRAKRTGVGRRWDRTSAPPERMTLSGR